MKYKLSEIMDIIGGGTPKTSCSEYWNGDIPWISVKDFNNDQRYVYETEKSITEAGLKNSSTKLLHKNDTVISARGTVGEMAMIPFPMAFNQSCYGLKAKEGIVTPAFLYYLVKHNIEGLRKNTHGSVFDTITRDTFDSIDVEVPSLQQQKKIAGVLEDLDDKIQLNTRINKNLEQQAQAIFQNIATQSSSEAKLSQFVNIKHGFAFKGDYISFNNNNVVLVTPGNFKIGGGFQESKCKYFSSSYSNDYVLHAGDLIVTMTDLSKEADTLGYGAFVPDNPDRTYLHNQRIGLVQFLNDDLDKDYLYWFLRSYKYHMSIVGSASGSTVKHTSPGRILDQQIPVPDKSFSSQISLLKSLDLAVSDNDVESRKLVSLRDALLPKLMSGEIDVSDIDL